MVMRKAVYAGSFDPVTNGHLWIIKQASQLFDSLVVSVGENFDKNYSFSIEERLTCLRDVTQSLSNIEITSFSNQFLVNYAKKVGARCIVRGIRNSSDYEYERSMRYINSDLSSDEILTVFLLPPRNYAEVSSSMVKGLVGSDGWESVVSKYVPGIVMEKLSKGYALNKRK